MSDDKKLCIEDVDNASCGLPATWLHCGQFSGDIPYCDKHALAQSSFGTNDSHWVWTRVGTPTAATVSDFIAGARAAGQDAFGIANDPEALAALDAAKAKANAPVNHHTRAPHQPTYAMIVEGELDYQDLLKWTYAARAAYAIKLVKAGPGAVVFVLTIDDKVHGSLPFDNLVKAATRIDPDHVVGTELQIQKLRRETADARAEMYDWRAKAEKLEERLADPDEKPLRRAAELLAERNGEIDRLRTHVEQLEEKLRTFQEAAKA
jgi:uncharacterized coiled-coil protein SlyX